MDVDALGIQVRKLQETVNALVKDGGSSAGSSLVGVQVELNEKTKLLIDGIGRAFDEVSSGLANLDEHVKAIDARAKTLEDEKVTVEGHEALSFLVANRAPIEQMMKDWQAASAARSGSGGEPAPKSEAAKTETPATQA